VASSKFKTNKKFSRPNMPTVPQLENMQWRGKNISTRADICFGGRGSKNIL